MKFSLPAITLFFCLTISAQTAKTVRSIDARYADLAEKARLCESDEDRGRYLDLVMNTLTINTRSHEWRAVGTYGETYKFFYRGGNSEKHLYPDQLVLVKVERKVSDRNYFEEYLYSDTGELMFYLSKQDESGPKEIRVYFAAKKPIRIVEDARSRDRITKADIFSVNQRVAEAIKIKRIFQLSIA